MQMTALQWCELLGGTLEGNPDSIITHPAKIEEAGEGAISFIAHPKYIDFAYSTTASALIVSKSTEFTSKVKSALIRVEQPYIAFSKVLEKFNKPYDELKGVDKTARIDETVSIGEEVFVGALSFIGKNAKIEKGVKIFPQVYVGESVVIGAGSVLHAGVKIYRECILGINCVIHSGTVIGGDGFGFAPQPDGSYLKIPQLGNVVIEDEVEIGANTTVDRATLGSTIIHRGVKLDNLIHVAHNVEIGEYTVIAAQTGISGSTKIGKYCQIGGQAGLVGHLVIADGTKINAQSGVQNQSGKRTRHSQGHPPLITLLHSGHRQFFVTYLSY